MVRACPVRSEEDVERLTLPNPRRVGRISQALRVARLQAEAGLPVTFFSRSPFTMAANLCGLETFLRWTVKRPALCQRLLELALDHIFNVLDDWQARFGAEALFVRFQLKRATAAG
jgi:uroporphyrinogen decarboxylase